MKIAVISDIHGNMDALDAVLKDAKNRGCEKIYALGDYAMAGPEPEKTVKWFIENSAKEHITMIQGNTDYMIANYSEELYESLKSKAPVMAEALKDDYENLSEDIKTYLRNLPEKLLIEERNVKILLVHGSPRRNNEDITPDTPMEEVEEMIKGVEAQVVLCGHTHVPCGFQTTTKQTVVNAGSVGRPFTPQPRACYIVMTIMGGKCIFEHFFVDYDKENASAKLAKRKFNGAKKLANTLLNPKERHF